MMNENLAPVTIPTLCRYEHFKRCIESLSRCTLADKTEVYVALDYPAKESHWDGYNKIKDYLLSHKEDNLGFKKLKAYCKIENKRAIRMARLLNFQTTHTDNQCVYFELDKDDYYQMRDSLIAKLGLS